ncbi:outer membrane protein transport protein [Candidatus Poribacteria bacterium]|nr:outer membrane protein transport protein [Candidatus Poribacteria bacterium]
MKILNRIILITFISVIVIQNISAEMYYMSDVLIGEKALGMGGAFSAVADSPEACFYNPAGLIYANEPYLSISAQVAESNEQVGKFLFSDNEKLFSQELVPSFFGISKDFKDGRIGFSIVVPYYSAYEMHLRYNNQKTIDLNSATVILDKKTMDKTYLIGPSYAYNINSDLSFGFTAYLNYKVSKEENSLYIKGKKINGSGTYLQSTRDESGGTGTGITGNMGFLYKATDKLNLSWVLKSGDYARNSIDYKGLSFFKPNDTTDLIDYDPLDEKADNKFFMPPGTTLGLAYKITPKLLFSYDLSYNFPIAYNIDYYKIPEYAKLTKRIKKNSVVNHNVGSEYMITESIPLRLGFYTNYSLAPDVDLTLSEKQSHLDKFGVTVSSGLISENSTLIISIKYGYGKGEMRAYNLLTDEIELHDLSFSSLGIGLSGTYWF